MQRYLISNLHYVSDLQGTCEILGFHPGVTEVVLLGCWMALVGVGVTEVSGRPIFKGQED